MEQRPKEQEGSENDQALTSEIAALVERDAGYRQQLIEYGIEAATGEGVVADWVARHIAQELGDEPGSALDTLARTGEVTAGLRYELLRNYEAQSPVRQRWIDSLGGYALNRAETGPVDGWTERAVPPERLADLAARLTPLPDLGDIPLPLPSRSADSGYDWMERLPQGWHVESSWGRDGWDLGAWPLVAVALFVDETDGRYAMATYTEGDVTVQRYGSLGALYVAVNEIAEFHWRLGESRGPEDLPEGKGLLAKHCGPFSWERLERDKSAERRRQGDAQDA